MVTVPRRAAEERGGRGPFFPRGGTGSAVKNIFPSKPRLSHNEKAVADHSDFPGMLERGG